MDPFVLHLLVRPFLGNWITFNDKDSENPQGIEKAGVFGYFGIGMQEGRWSCAFRFVDEEGVEVFTFRVNPGEVLNTLEDEDSFYMSFKNGRFFIKKDN